MAADQIEPTSETPDTRPARWASWLLIATSGLLLFLLVSGLVVFLAPIPSDFTASQSWFWVTVQWLILLHTFLGLIAIVIYAIYQWRHYVLIRHARLNWGKLLGYLSLGVFLLSAVTGVYLTWEAWAGDRITYWVDVVHTWGSLALAPLLGVHLIQIWVRARRRATTENPPRLTGPQRRLIWGSSLFAVLLLGIGGILGLAVSGPDISAGVPPQTYSLKYGLDPFDPSNVATSTGGALNDVLMAGSEQCGTCHKDIYKEWEASAHRWSASDVFYTTVASAMEADTGIESTRYCGGCHNPITILSGNLTPVVATALKEEGKTGQEGRFYEEGISCTVCHGITQIQGVKGNANYKFTPPPRYLFELETDNGLLEQLGAFLIRAFPKTHKQTLSRGHYKLPEFCGTCHKQYIDEFVNDFGWVRLQNQYDNWKESKWNSGPDDPATIVCIECHMPLVENDQEVSSGVSDGDPFGPHPDQHRSHRWLGANQAIPWLLEDQEQVDLTERWLKGEYEIPEIADKWEDGPAIATAVTAPLLLAKGQPLEYQVIITNVKAGHEFPTGPLDLIQTWIDTTVTDASGNVLLHSGFLDEKNYIDPDAHYFRTFPIDEDGNVIDRHNLWDMVGSTYVRVIFPGFSEEANYEVAVPADTEGPLTITATLRMRKFHQSIVDLATDNSGLTFPITDLSSFTAVVELGESVVGGTDVDAG